jgi:type IV pilus assembly protein PilO
MRIGLRETLLLGTLVTFPVAAYFLAFQPRNAEMKLAKEDITLKRTQLDKVRQTTARVESLGKQIEETQAKIKAIEAQLPTGKEVDTIVRAISDLAVEAGLEAPSIESDKPVAAALYMEQPLKIKLTGPFKDGESGFYPFLVKLEQLPRITRITNMKLARSKDNNGFMIADFTLSIYFQSEEQAAKAAAADKKAAAEKGGAK